MGISHRFGFVGTSHEFVPVLGVVDTSHESYKSIKNGLGKAECQGTACHARSSRTIAPWRSLKKPARLRALLQKASIGDPPATPGGSNGRVTASPAAMPLALTQTHLGWGSPATPVGGRSRAPIAWRHKSWLGGRVFWLLSVCGCVCLE